MLYMKQLGNLSLHDAAAGKDDKKKPPNSGSGACDECRKAAIAGLDNATRFSSQVREHLRLVIAKWATCAQKNNCPVDPLAKAAAACNSRDYADSGVQACLSHELTFGAKGTSPSFGCAATTAADEVTICHSATLSKLDRELSEQYRQLLNNLSAEQRTRLRSGQRDWLNKRADCGTDEDCIQLSYRDRILYLRGLQRPAAVIEQ